MYKKCIKILIISSAITTQAIGVGSLNTSQYTARLFTEILGRIPDQTGWNTAMKYWSENTCSRKTLKLQGMDFFKSEEFQSMELTNTDYLLIAYRAIMNREPDVSGLNNYRYHLDNGLSITKVASIFYDSDEFLGISGEICGEDEFHWVPSTALNLADLNSKYYSGSSGDELQHILDTAKYGSVVKLSQRTVVFVDKPLTIPDGITLMTVGSPSPRYYTRMARIIRNASSYKGNDFELIKMGSHSKVKNLWISGERSEFGFSHNNIGVRAYGGNELSFSENKISDTAGWTSFQIWGSAEGHVCSSATINSNLITMYSSSHYDGSWTDGLSIACESAIVENNDIVDPTDVGIVVYRSGDVGQSSKIKYNHVLNAGNGAFGGIVIDPLFDKKGYGRYNFKNTKIHDNVLWSSPQAHIDIGISLGTKAWYGNQGDRGYGTEVYSNSSGWSTLNANIGVGISGLLDTVVYSNNVQTNIQENAMCSTGLVVADVSNKNASGSIQSYLDMPLEGCISH